MPDYLASVNRELLRLALPNILSNISVPLLSSVDTALMGHLSAAHLGAIGIGGMAFNFIYWNFGFLRMGTTGLTAQAVGARDDSRQGTILVSASVLGLGIALLLLAFQVPLLAAAQALLNTPTNQLDLVREYFAIRILAAPAALLLYVLAGWFFGQQNAWIPLLVTTVANVVNIAVSVYLVQNLGLETSGVAWGTVIAQYAALLIAATVLLWRYRSIVAGVRLAAALEWGNYRRLLQVNADIFVRTLALTFAFGFVFSRSASASALALATTTVLLQFLNWMSYAIDGFAYAAEALVGKTVGAQRPERTRQAIRLSFGYGGACAVAFALVYALFGEQLVSLFTDDASVQAFAKTLWPYLIALPLVGTACYIWDGVFVGLTATKAMRDTMFLSLVAYLSTYYALRVPLGEVVAIWTALLVLLGSRGLLQTLWYHKRGLALR